MIIDIARMPEGGERFTGEEPGSILDLGKDAYVQAPNAVKYDLKACVVSQELIIQGRVSVEAVFRCSRCVADFAVQVEEPAFSFAMEIKDGVESVDLTEEIREAMLLAFPPYPVCSEGCKGLCAQCGANLNEVSCGCKTDDDVRWNELDDLKL